VQGKGNIQFLRIAPDMHAITATDSLSPVLKAILLTIVPPAASVKVIAEPLKIAVESEELNMGDKLGSNLVTPLIAKSLSDAGNMLVSKNAEADYVVRIQSSTESNGAIWGDMQSSTLTVNVTLVDASNQLEIYRDRLTGIRGFQKTPANAGLDAYKKAGNAVAEKLVPALLEAIFSGR
jgi:hypothetical protein